MFTSGRVPGTDSTPQAHVIPDTVVAILLVAVFLLDESQVITALRPLSLLFKKCRSVPSMNSIQYCRRGLNTDHE